MKGGSAGAMAGPERRMPVALDVLGFGVLAVDEVLYVDRFPPPDAQTPIRRWVRRPGGLAGMALVAAARLGARVAYAGRLGQDALSESALEALRSHGVDTSHVVRETAARPYHSVVVVDLERHGRNVFFEVGTDVAGAHPSLPSEDLIRASRVVLVDHLGLPGMTRISEIARGAEIPVVGDIEDPGTADLSTFVDMIDHLLVSFATAAKLSGASDPRAAAAALWRTDRACVVVTAGAAGAWFVSRDRPGNVRHQSAYPVTALDTTGCGDVFHGAYAHAIARGDGPPEAIRFASAAAAVMATRSGLEHVPPTTGDVDELLSDQASDGAPARRRKPRSTDATER